MDKISQIIFKIDKFKVYNEVVNLAQLIPESGEITVDMASILQTKCWAITLKLTKLIADMELYVGELKRKRDDVLADQKAISNEKSESGKERVAKCTQVYRDLADEAVVSEVALNKLLNQKKFFDNGVYVMRSRQEKEKRDWQSTPTYETN